MTRNRTEYVPTGRVSALRVIALSTAIAANAAMLGVLTLPRDEALALLSRVKPADKPLEVEFVPRAVIAPPPLVRPQVDPPRIVRPQRVEPPRVVVRDLRPVFVDAVMVDTTVTEFNEDTTDSGSETAINAQPLTDAQLNYVDAPQPKYPMRELRNRVEGEVVLRVLVDENGLPIDVQIAKSSGSAALDRAARDKVRSSWRFVPATRMGMVTKAWALVPINFKLMEA
jgi:protein TonB